MLFAAILVSASAAGCTAAGSTNSSQSTAPVTNAQPGTPATPQEISPSAPPASTTPPTPSSPTSSERPTSGLIPAPSRERFTPLAERNDPGTDDFSPRHEVGRLTRVVEDGEDTLLVVNRVTWTWCHLPGGDSNDPCENAEPPGYKVTDENPRLRTYRLAPSAAVLVRDDADPKPHPSDLAGLRARITDAPGAGDGLLVVLRHDDTGDITGISEVFTP